VASGKIALVRQMVIEYHHNVPAEPAALSRLLALLEQAGFSYQLSAWTFPPVRQGHFQAVMIAAFRPSSQSSHPETLVPRI
jgi:hypothetical protein